MEPHHFELYRRIQAFDLDAVDAQFTLSERLARENRWSADFTWRVIEEYKKFAFLAMAAGHPVTPSDQVDQVWHLHLTYTRSYWDEFCPQILGKPLHHEPTQGGEREKAKFNDWYGKTLASYQRLFGEKPPTDIWPAAAQRFGRDLHFVRVNQQQHWLIPKPWQSDSGRKAMGLIALSSLPLFVASCTGEVSGLNSLSLGARDFLILYTSIWLLMMLAMFGIRSALSHPRRELRPLGVLLTIEEMAYLADGSFRAVDIALISLLQKGCVELDDKSKKLRWAAPGDDLSTLEGKVLQYVAAQNGRIDRIRRAATTATDTMLTRLQRLDLCVPTANTKQATHYVWLLFTPLFFLGIARLAHGISLGKPIGFLTILLIAVFATGLLFINSPLRRSRFGDEEFTRLSKQATDKSTDNGLLQAVALTGISALTGTAWANVIPIIKPQGDNSGGCGGSGCGGGGCGGGCGG
jgi:uncharacterized protein (TIGR04222 family)